MHTFVRCVDEDTHPLIQPTLVCGEEISQLQLAEVIPPQSKVTMDPSSMLAARSRLAHGMFSLEQCIRVVMDDCNSL